MRVRVGILKPDHLGDFILAAPAIASLQRRFERLTLFCHPKNLALAAHLFPRVAARPLYLPHLDKDRQSATGMQAGLRMIRDEVDLLVCLRWDGQIERLLSIPQIEYHAPGTIVDDVHVTAEHRLLLVPFTGPYDILKSYTYPHCPPVEKRPTELGSVGLCISAGFHLNAWPLCNWLGLAQCLKRADVQVVLIGGPGEVRRLHALAEACEDALAYRPALIVGTNDFGATLQELHSRVDLVVATDSGTAHLASLVKPIVSLFGGSPWRRFAPLGRFNAILSRHYPCSPCQQFNRTSANLCYTQECLTNLTPELVDACLRSYLAGLDFSGGVQMNSVWMTQAPWAEVKSAAA
jgi:heptosyltransferase-2